MIKIDGLVFSLQEAGVIVVAIFTMGFLLGGLAVTSAVSYLWKRKRHERQRKNPRAGS